MNNITDYNNNLTFGKRYLKFSPNVPKQVRMAVLNNESIDAFIREGNPQTFWGKVKDFFKPAEYLDVIYSVEEGNEKFKQTEIISFLFGGYLNKTRFLHKRGYQEGFYKATGITASAAERAEYCEPKVKAIDILVEKINQIKDFNKELV